MNTQELMRDRGMTEKSIINAIDERTRKPENGLCWSFSMGNKENDNWYVIVPEILNSMGGKADHNDLYWTRDCENERLMMLAFLLTLAQEND